MSSGSSTAVSSVAPPPSFSLNSTWGGDAAESYVSYAEAHAFITSKIVDSTSWTDASTTQRVASLIEATRDIDSRQYIGSRYYRTQRLEMPRALPGRTCPVQNAVSVSTPTELEQVRLKERVQSATCHQALWILRNGGQNIHMENVSSGISEYSEKAGDTAESYKYRGGMNRVCSEAVAILRPYLDSRRVYRG